MSRQALEANRSIYQEVIDTRAKGGQSAPVPKLVEIARRSQDVGALDGVMTLVHNFWGETTGLLIANELGVPNADIDGNIRSGYIADPTRAGKAATVERKIALDMVLASKNANRLLLPLVLGAQAERMDAAHEVALNETGRGQYTGHRQPGETAHPLDCTTYLLEVLELAFNAAGKPDVWRRVKSTMRVHTKGNALSGVHLQRALQDELGWVGVYITPLNVNRSEQLRDHELGSEFYGVKSSVRIHNYGIHDGAGEEVQKLLERIPFGILAVSAADHMAMMVRGIVYEVHISETSESADVVAASPFFNYFQKSRGGLLLVPPESAPKADFDGKVDEENPYANLDRQGQAMRRIPWMKQMLDKRLEQKNKREELIAKRRSGK